MSRTTVTVLKTVRIADGDMTYGREIVAGTQDSIPDELVASLVDEGYIEVDTPVDQADDAPQQDAGGVDPQGLFHDASSAMTKEELIAYAAEKGIDLGGAKTKAEILAAFDAFAAKLAGGDNDPAA